MAAPGRPLPVLPQIPSLMQPSGGGGVGGLLGTLFTGRADPQLSPEQNAAAGREGLTQALLAAVLASGSRSPVRGLLPILATGALAGRAGGQMARAEFGQTNRAAQIMDRYRGASPQQLQNLMVELLASGDAESAKAVADLIKAQQTEQPNLMEVKVGNRTLLVNPVTGETVREIEGGEELESKDLGDRIVWFVKGQPDRVRHVQFKFAAPSSERPNLSVREFVDESGTPRLGAFDPTQGTITPIEGASPIPRAGNQASELRTRVLTSMVAEPLNILENATAPGRVEQILANIGIRELTSPEMQQLKNSADAVASVYTFLLSGVTARPDEIERARGLFQPMPGDKPETIEWKRGNIRRFRELLNNPEAWHPAARAAGGIPPGMGTGMGGGDPFADLVPGGGF